MAEICGFWDSQNGDERVYTADDFNGVMQMLFGDGIVGDSNALKAEWLSEFRINVKPGCALIDGHWYQNTEDKVFTVPVPESGTRYDRIVLRLNRTQRKIGLVLREGDSSGAPEPYDNSTYKEISICNTVVVASRVVSVNNDRAFISLKNGGG